MYEELNLIQSNKYGIVNLLKKVIKSLLNKNQYDPTDFINYFCNNNRDFIKGNQCCSQNFIRTLIKNINFKEIVKANYV